MGRRPKPTQEKTVQVGIRLDPEQLADIDAEIEELHAEKGVEVTRSAIIRAWINEARERRRTKKK